MRLAFSILTIAAAVVGVFFMMTYAANGATMLRAAHVKHPTRDCVIYHHCTQP